MLMLCGKDPTPLSPVPSPLLPLHPPSITSPPRFAPTSTPCVSVPPPPLSLKYHPGTSSFCGVLLCSTLSCWQTEKTLHPLTLSNRFRPVFLPRCSLQARGDLRVLQVTDLSMPVATFAKLSLDIYCENLLHLQVLLLSLSLAVITSRKPAECNAGNCGYTWVHLIGCF